MAGRKPKVHKDTSERWLLSYADFITLLMIFFIILYAMSSTNTRKFNDLSGALQKAFNNGDFQIITIGGSPGTPKANKGNSGSQQLYKRVKDDVMQLDNQLGISKNVVHVGQMRDGVDITMAGNLLFYPGYTQLRPESQKLLYQIALLLRHLPNAVRVEANTDNLTSPNAVYASNWVLSSMRADSIVEEFVNDGVTPAKLSAIGLSQYHPVASNATVAGRARNRRADIIILYPNKN